MLLSLKDDNDDNDEDIDVGLYDDEDDTEHNDDEKNSLCSDRQLVESVSKANKDNTDLVVQQTVLDFDQHDFFGTSNHLVTETVPTHNGHTNTKPLVNMGTPTTITSISPAKTTSLLATTHDSRILTSPSQSNEGGSSEYDFDQKTNVDEIADSSSSNNSKALANSQQHYSCSNSPRSADYSHTNSPALRRQQNYSSAATSNNLQSAPRLFTSNVLPTHLRKDSYYDDTDEICLVPEVDFENSTAMDHCTDNRESQPLLGGGGGGNASSRDHFEVVCNTFVGKFCFCFIFFIFSPSALCMSWNVLSQRNL